MSAAKKMVQLLRKTERRELIQEMERLCMAYIQLANWDVTQYKKETSKSNEQNGLKRWWKLKYKLFMWIKS